MANAPSEWNAFQSLLSKAFNRLVREDFRDNVPEDFDTDPESTLKNLLLIKNKDSTGLCTLKVLIFFGFRIYQKVNDILDRFDTWQDIEDRPYLKIVFKEMEPYKVPDLPMYPENQFRLNLDTEDLTEQRVEQLKIKVRQQFPSSFRFKGGPQKYHYLDPKRGYRNFIYAQNAVEAKNLMTRLLAVQDIQFDEEKWSHKGQTRVRVTRARYKGKVYTRRSRKNQSFTCQPFKAMIYPGSGIRPELLTNL